MNHDMYDDGNDILCDDALFGDQSGHESRRDADLRVNKRRYNNVTRPISRRHVNVEDNLHSQWAPGFIFSGDDDGTQVSVEIWGDQESECSVCNESFKSNDLVVFDCFFTHISCWNPTDSNCILFKEALRKRSHKARLNYISRHLRSRPIPVSGWEQLPCRSRLEFVTQLFSSKKNCDVSCKEIFDYLPCGNCNVCNNPQWCSFQKSCTSCCYPDMVPNYCSKCNGLVHSLCQNTFETEKKCPQEVVLCYECHPYSNKRKTRSHTSGKTRNFPTKHRKTNHNSSPTIISSSPSEFLSI